MTDENLEKRVKAKRLLRDVLGGIVLAGCLCHCCNLGILQGIHKGAGI